MELNVKLKHVEDPATKMLIEYLVDQETVLGLRTAQLYHRFPIYRDSESEFHRCDVLLISPFHGIIAFGVANTTALTELEDVRRTDNALDSLFSGIYSRLLNVKSLRSSRTTLAVPAESIIFAPNFRGKKPEDLQSRIAVSTSELQAQIQSLSRSDLSIALIGEAISTLDGSKALVRPRLRQLEGLPPTSKGHLVARLEAEILSFDQRQKQTWSNPLTGPQRVRGLAGSGKTVVLAVRAAHLHLEFPDAKILITFSTKSLYQHIKALITRFYRQHSDRDPDWDKLSVLHAWGGRSYPGTYYAACLAHGVPPMRYDQAKFQGGADPFKFVCDDLQSKATIRPQYDFILIDEGQDFPISFLQLCGKLAKDAKFVLAYDELQTIFQPNAPSAGEVFGFDAQGKPNREFEEDEVLYKCYRNPREILVAAHALGLGVYGASLVQIPEDKGHWEDLGYELPQGDPTAGKEVSVLRPEKNSLKSISSMQDKKEIVKAASFSSYSEEIKFVLDSIEADVADGLAPEDILVSIVDDRSAKKYALDLTSELANRGLQANNIHADPFGLVDFQIPNHVTISTVHKAKGNEAYVVYVVGAEYLFAGSPGVRDRNILFTAVTRAKGWVRISGVGDATKRFLSEIEKALTNFPYLKFIYPTAEQIHKLRRDLQTEAIEKQTRKRKFEELIEEFGEDEAREILDQRKIRKTLKDKPD